MDNSLLVVIIPAALVLIGTIVTVIVQRNQPGREKRVESKAQLLAEKQGIYKELWEKIESVHILMRRADNLSVGEFRTQLADVNSYIMTKSLYVEKQDWDLANRYLNAIRKFKEVMDGSDDETLKTDMASTERLGGSLATQVAELAESAAEVDQLRDQLLARFHLVINAQS